MSSPPARYRRLAPSEAMQYTRETCRALHEWLQQTHVEEDDRCGDTLFMEDSDGLNYTVKPDRWVVRHPNGWIEVIDDEDFRAQFEPCQPEEPRE